MKLINGDCLVEMRNIPDASVDMVITSPPYNVGVDYDGYNDNMDYNDYTSWLAMVFGEFYRILKKDGRACINIGDGKNGSVPTHSDIIQICMSIGFNIMTTIIWNKNTTSKRSAWGSFMSPSCPSFPRNFEYILVFSKSKKLIRKGEPSITKKNFIDWSNGLWTFAPEKNIKSHPAPFPIELPRRCIEMLTYKKDLILDPFMGSGTVGVACERLDRDFIGIEISKEYYEIAKYRIGLEQAQMKLF